MRLECLSSLAEWKTCWSVESFVNIEDHIELKDRLSDLLIGYNIHRTVASGFPSIVPDSGAVMVDSILHAR